MHSLVLYCKKYLMSTTKLSHLSETLIGSEIVKLGNLISERIRAGEKIYNFTIGDFDPKIFPIPAELEALIIESYQQRNTSYPAAEGVLDLRKAVSSFLKEWEGLEYAPNEIQIASGGRPLIYTIFKAIVDKGDKVVYGVPSWNNNHYVHMTDGEHCVVECSVENNFMPTVNDIREHVKGATLICLCTPQNPTGTTLTKHDLSEICDLILVENASRKEGEKKCYLLFDQMYWTLTYGNTAHYNPMGPEIIISKMKAILSHLGAWAPMAEQKAVAKYLYEKDAIANYLTHFKSEIELRLHQIYDGFIALKEKGFAVDSVTPQAAIYLTIKIDLVGKKEESGKILLNQADVTSYILSNAKLAVVPFSAFGGSANNPWYRLSVGTCIKEEIPEMLKQLETALSKLK